MVKPCSFRTAVSADNTQASSLKRPHIHSPAPPKPPFLRRPPLRSRNTISTRLKDHASRFSTTVSYPRHDPLRSSYERIHKPLALQSSDQDIDIRHPKIDIRFHTGNIFHFPRPIAPSNPFIVASPRGLSPVRSQLRTPARPTARMPSPRNSPALRPTSPLSPQPACFDMLQPPSPRTNHSRAGNNTRRANTHSLKLPSLPRFHPANYPSSHSSYQNTPEGLVSPQQPISPRAHSRMYSDAQKQLLMYHRETIAAASRGQSPSGERKPMSPRLVPMGSPGPVTPLELEQQGGYLMAGVREGASQGTSQDELVERLIREETRRNGRTVQATGGARPSSR